ncbi:MAG: hypothetical protein IPK13_17710 [Deltaproteobacteria bacterium]|nr:hypothetical protein [Deltaproteobacteria bacterium]
MRWQLVLQTAVGFGVLFWLGRDAAERYVGPPSEAQAERTAQAEARAVVSQVARKWVSVRDAHRSLLATQTTGSILTILEDAKGASDSASDSASEDGAKGPSSELGALLVSALAQAGVEGGSAAFVAANGTSAAALGPGSTQLSSVASTKEALAGSSTVRFDRLEDHLFIIGSAPVVAAHGGTAPVGALALALPLDDARLRGWVTSDPEMAGTHVALFQGSRLVASTLPSADQQGVQTTDGLGVSLRIQGRSYAVARSTMTDDAGFGLTVVGLVPVDRLFVTGVIDGAQALISILGGIAFLVVLVVIAAAPRPAPEVVEIPAEAPPVDETAASSFRGAPPSRPMALAGAQAAARAGPTDSAHGAAAASMGVGANSWRTGYSSSDPSDPSDSAAFGEDDGDVSSLEPTPLPLPLDALSEAAPSGDDGMPVDHRWTGGAASVRSRPPMGAAPSAVPEAASDLFSAIDRAASSSAPHVGGAPSSMSGLRVDPAEDLPAPKGGMPLGVSPALAAHSPSTDLPMPKGGSFPGFGAAMPVSQPTVSNPNRQVLPPLSQTPPLPDRDRGGARGAPEVPDFPEVPEASEAVVEARKAETAPEDPLPSPPPAFPAPPAFPRSGAAGSRPPDAGRGASSDLGAPGGAPPGSMAKVARGADDEAVALPGRSARGGAAQAEDGAVALPGAAAPSAPGRAPSQAASGAGPARSPESPTAFDETHYRVVYNEFVASKARLGDAIDDVTFEGFSARLRSSERDLIQRHGCRAVRFQVLVKDRTVSLRPQLVR